MKRLLVAAAIAVTAGPALAAGPILSAFQSAAASGAGSLGTLPTASSAKSLPNFGEVTSSTTIAADGFGKSFKSSKTYSLPMLGTFGHSITNTGKGGTYIAQFSHQSPSAVAAGDQVPAASPAPTGGTSKLPPFAISYERIGAGFGAGSPLQTPPVLLPANLGTGQLTLTNQGANGRSIIAASYSTH